MKKILIGLFVFGLLFIGAQTFATEDGCPTGQNYSSTTGQKCGCSHSEVYSLTTGLKCFEELDPEICCESFGTYMGGQTTSTYSTTPKSKCLVTIPGGGRNIVDNKFCKPITNTPVILGVSGPQTLKVDQTGTWTTKASDPNGRPLTYSVVWNMVKCGSTSTGWCGSKEANHNSSTFAHIFSSAGSYDIGFIVQNDLDFNSGLADALKIIHVEVKPLSVDNDCSNGQLYSLTTGQECPVIKDDGCHGAIYSLTTGQKCPISTITTEAGCDGLNIYSLSTGQVCPVDKGCNGTNYSTTTGKACPAVTIIDKGCTGANYSFTTGQRCPISTITTHEGCNGINKYSPATGQTCPVVDNPIVLKNDGIDNGCNGANKYSSTTGQVCANYNGQNIGGGNNYLPRTTTPIRRTLKLGIKGDDVKTLQAFLNLLADGSFGPKTRAKVIEWQRANGLTPDGAFGNMSRQKANLAE